MTVVEFFFDIISSYSLFQYELLLRQSNQWKSMELKMTPVLIKDIFEKSQNKPPGVNPTKLKYCLNELKLLSEFHKIPFHLDDDFMKTPKTTEKTQKFLIAIQDKIDKEQYHKLIGEFFHKFYSKNYQNICEPDNMKIVCKNFGIDSKIIDKALEEIESNEIEIKLQENINRVMELGGFGLPITLIHNEKDPKWVFGSDRMHIIGYLLGEKQPPILR